MDATRPGTEPMRALRAGPLSLILDGVDLRYVRLGGRELVRRVYVAVRDRNWDTIPATIAGLRIDEAAESFTVSFEAAHREGAIGFAWRGTIVGGSDGSLSYTMHGEARSTFLKNRIGLCVLHPMDLAGLSCTLLKSDGSLEETAFPAAIAPHQPFADLCGIAHDAAPGVRVEIRLDGDVFETEDQRNWTDASYKTYSTPLHLPYPVEVARGARIEQSFALALSGISPVVGPSGRIAPDGDDCVAFDIDRAAVHPLPHLGLGMARHAEPPGEAELAQLRALHLAHLRVDLDLRGDAYGASWAAALGLARALGVPLEVALFVSDDAARELAALVALLGGSGPSIARWLVFHRREKSTSGHWVDLARRSLGGVAPGAPFGGGTNAYFAELNRERPVLERIDAVCYSINPQVHAFDDASLVESLAAQASTLESARAFCGDLPLVVGPVTLRPRFNPNATGPEPEPEPGQLPPQVDPRQMSLLGAAWTLGSVAYLARGGAASATYFETTGWRGVMAGMRGSPLPALFPAAPGMLFPLYHVLADIGEGAADGAVALDWRSGDPLRVAGLALRGADGAHMRILIANLTNWTTDIRVGGLGAAAAWVRTLDERSVERATREGAAFRGDRGARRECADEHLHLTLLPHATARIDIEPSPEGVAT